MEKDKGTLTELKQKITRLQGDEPHSEGARRRWAEEVEGLTAEYQEALRVYEIRKSVYLSFVQATQSPYDFKHVPTVRAVLRF